MGDATSAVDPRPLAHGSGGFSYVKQSGFHPPSDGCGNLSQILSEWMTG